jgi:hypothetical protein
MTVLNVIHALTNKVYAQSPRPHVFPIPAFDGAFIHWRSEICQAKYDLFVVLAMLYNIHTSFVHRQYYTVCITRRQ